jgi:hypothetical protein
MPNQRQAASIAACVLLLVQSANRDQGPATCFLGRRSAGHLRLDMPFEMEVQFLVEFCVDAPGRDE